MTTATQEKPAATAGQPEAQAGPVAVVERLPQREHIVVESAIPVLDTAMFEHMQRIATMMASSNLVPEHLNKVMKVKGTEIMLTAKEAVANCFLVTNQAIRWRMDPFAVAQHTFVTKGKIGYEGKMIAAVINTHPAIEKRLSYAYAGSGKERAVTVTAKLKGDTEPRSVVGKVKDWETTGAGSPWSNPNQHDQMLSYRGAREWARRWLPEAALGVWGDDELEMFENTERTVDDRTDQPQRGAAGLRAALVDKDAAAQGSVEIAAPAVASPEAPAAAAQTPPPQTKGKPAGTPEEKSKLLEKFKRCEDLEVLALAADLIRGYTWADEDLAELSKAQDDRAAALRG